MLESFLGAVIIVFFSSIILILVFLYLYLHFKDIYLKYWLIGWILYSFRLLVTILIEIYGNNQIFLVFNQGFNLFNGYYIYIGSKKLVKTKDADYTKILVVVITIWVFFSTFFDFDFYLITIPPFFVQGFFYINTGFSLLRKDLPKSVGQKVTGICFILWGFLKFGYPFLRNHEYLSIIGFYFGSFFGITISLGMFLIYFEVERYRILSLEYEYFKSKNLQSLNLLAGGIAHDFNNLLSIMQGNIDFIELDEEIEDESRIMIEDIKIALVRAKNLTLQLLNFSKGGIPIKKTGKLDELLEEIIQFHLRGTSIKYTIYSSKEIWLCEFDFDQLSQVFTNLLINAKQAMDSHGEIKCSIENYIIKQDKEIPGCPKGKYVRIIIRDNGKGIPKSIQDEIFCQYFTTKAKGNGLGLSICKSIIENHNGIITCESKEGEFTEFTIYLPASKSDGIAENEKLNKTGKINELGEFSEISGKKIVILEDRREILAILNKLIQKFGGNTISFTRGEELIDYINNNKDSIDLMILDLTVVGGKGAVEVLKHLKSHEISINSIITSGYLQENLIKSYISMGFVDFLRKPFSIQELIEILNRNLK